LFEPNYRSFYAIQSEKCFDRIGSRYLVGGLWQKRGSCCTNAAASNVVKIGHVGPTSGAIAHLGKDNENGARMAIEELNAAGVMIDGKKVTLEADGRRRRRGPQARHCSRPEAGSMPKLQALLVT
jgi:hypothetical protein